MNDDPFPVKPNSKEYEALSLLVAHYEYGFPLHDIANRIALSKASTSKAMTRLLENDLVERTENFYYIDPRRINELAQRLKSIDSVVQFFESTPNDDIYAKEGWEQELSKIDPEVGADTPMEDPTTAEARSEALIIDIEDCCEEE